jgi:hypothetical protein
MAAEVLVETFAAAPAEATWLLHTEGAGRVTVDGGALLLDLSAPAAGKQAWAELVPWLKLPLSIAWRQRIVRDSPHLYHAGLYLLDPTGRVVTFGLSGQPLGHCIRAAGKTGSVAQVPGEWVRFVLAVDATRQARLNVAGTGGEERFEVPLGLLSGRLVRAGFFHNQPRDQGPDAYAQDRGVSAVADLRLRAAAFFRGDPATYRDPDLRGMNPREPIVFNRALRWFELPTEAGGGALAYAAAGSLALTGAEQVAAWHTSRGCAMESVDPTSSRFRRPNDMDGADSAAIPMLQWCLRQHPWLDYELVPQGGAVRLSVFMPCAYLGRGVTLFQTEAATAPQRGRLDLAERFAAFGLGERTYGEIGLALDQERGPDNGDSTCLLRVGLSGPGALISGPALVRTPQQAAAGIVVGAVVAGPDGQLLRGDSIAVTGRLPGVEIGFAEAGGEGLFTATLRGLPVGTHRLELTAGNAAVRYAASQEVCVSPLPFAIWSPGQPTYSTPAGDPVPTLLGDLLAWVPLLKPSAADRRVIATAEQWQALTPDAQKAVGLVKLRTLGREHIAVMLDAYAAAGVRVIRLTPNVSPKESILDACGHAAPHGLETLAWTLAECRARGIRALINLCHYPYGSAGTGSYPPWRQYAEAGYRGEGSFLTPEIGQLLHGYLAEVLAVTRNDAAVLGYSLTGENDQSYPAPWVNDLFAFVRGHDPNHVITLEQGGGILQRAGGVPWSYAEFAAAKSGGVGYRTYYTGGIETDAYIMICGRAYRSDPPAFMAEEASGPGWYGGFHRDWQHPDFLTKVRDVHWMAVLCQHTMSLCWSAPWSQSECQVPQRCLDQLDWGRFRREQPLLGLRLGAVTAARMPKLAAWERLLASQGVDYDYVWSGAPERIASGHYEALLDADAAPDLALVPPTVLARRPLTVSAGRSVSLLLSRSPFQMLALVRNTAEHRPGPGYGTGVHENHRQRSQAMPLAITFATAPAGAQYKVYDLEARRCCHQGTLAPGLTLDLGTTAMDAAVLISELPLSEGW